MKKETEKEIKELVRQMTLDEKIGMIHGAGLFHTKGVERLGIPPLTMSDGPMGVRCEFLDSRWSPVGNSDDYVSYLPSNSALAATWNRELAKKCGTVLGEEARGRGKDVILAPGINIKRSPLCGRNFEYLSEDPYLTGEMAVPFIQGVQSADTSACVKHFAVNSQETERMRVEAEVSDRALNEIYLPAFKKAVKEGKVWSVMGAYNRLRGEHCCESRYLLTDILRREWDFDGMVVSDWGGVHDTEKAAFSDLDLEMSVTDNFDDYCMAEPLKRAVKEGKIPESAIDKKAENILRLMYRIHSLGEEKRKPGCYNTAEHRQAILDAARESVILLKNTADRLPLYAEKVHKVLVIGDNANRQHSYGGGSAEIKALYEITPLMGIKKLLGGNARVDYLPGYYADHYDHMNTETNWQADSLENGGGTTEERAKADAVLLQKQKERREQALEAARGGNYDTVIYVGGQNHFQDLEGHDRPDMKLPYDQDTLIRELLDIRPDMVVVLVSGSPVEMPWIDRADTLVWHWYAGMEGGTALAEVLFGRVNPSGKLPETFPVTHTDCPAHCIGEFPGAETVKYTEDIFVGYRYYDTFQKKVLFPFGYGLSYTKFAYGELMVQEETGTESSIRISLPVTNTGSREGKEIVQIYVGRAEVFADPDFRPVKELRAFVKLTLAPGETGTAVFTLSRGDFGAYNEEKGCFITQPGSYRIYAGRSSADIAAAAEIVFH